MAAGLKPLIVTVTDIRSGVSFVAAFDDSPILIGRGEDVSLQLDRHDISHHHATIAFDDSRILFTDLDSRNGSLVEDIMYAGGEEIALTEASDVRFGSLKLSLSRDQTRRPSPGSVNPFAPTKPKAHKPATGVLSREAIEQIQREIREAKNPPPRAQEPLVLNEEPPSASGPVPEPRLVQHRDSQTGSLSHHEEEERERTSSRHRAGTPPNHKDLPKAPSPSDVSARTVLLGHSPKDRHVAAVASADPRLSGTIANGTLLSGRYRLQGLIGRGGMGAVYKAHDESLDVPIAIKTLANAHELTPDLLERFFREAQVIRAVSHPNIVVVHDVGRDGDLPYIAMELLKGEDLGAAIERDRLEIPDAVDIILGVCAGLQAAHERGLVHRDLKPQNIFLSKAWRVQDAPKILDFGISKTSGSKLTQAGDIMGTEHYLSPEQALDSNNVDARSDIYALGVILYECITQRPPHDGNNVYLVIKNIVEGNIRPLRQIRPDVSESFANIVHRAMAMEPSRRYESAHDLARALIPFASARGQRMWSDHYSTVPPEDPMLSGPHANPGKEGLKPPSAPGSAPASPVIIGGTKVLPESVRPRTSLPMPTPQERLAHAKRWENSPIVPAPVVVPRRRTTPRTSLVLAAGALVAVIIAIVVVVLRQSNSATPEDAPSTTAETQPVITPPTPPPPAPIPVVVAPSPAVAAPVAEVPAPSPSPITKDRARSRAKKVRYNADGIPLVQ